MSKIIQLAVALNNEGEESLYALTDDGQVLQRRYALLPRKIEYVEKPTRFIDGWTEGWAPVESGWSMPIKHLEDKSGAS
jgi:hypothetical protein